MENHSKVRFRMIFCIVFAVAMLLRVLYIQHTTPYYFVLDSEGYYSLSQKLWTGNILANFISEHRTPAYPFILATIHGTTGIHTAQIESAHFDQDMHIIVLIQSLVGLLGLLILYRTLRLLKIHERPAILYVLFIGANVLLFTYERGILTEVWARAFLIGTFLVLAKILLKPQLRHFLALTLLFCFGFLLKPVYIALPFVLLPWLAFHFRKQKRALRLTIVSGIFYGLLPLGYIFLNTHIHGYPGVNHIGDINVLGRILQYNLPLESAKNDEFFYTKITEYKDIKGDISMPYHFLNWADPAIYSNTERLNELQSFTSTIVTHQLPAYLWNSFRDIPYALFDIPPHDVLLISDIKDPSVRLFFHTLASVYGIIQRITILVFPLWCVSVFHFIRKPTVVHTMLVLLGSASIYQVLGSILLGYSEFGRLVSIVQPLLYLFTFWGLFTFMNVSPKARE